MGSYQIEPFSVFSDYILQTDKSIYICNLKMNDKE